MQKNELGIMKETFYGMIAKVMSVGMKKLHPRWSIRKCNMAAAEMLTCVVGLGPTSLIDHATAEVLKIPLEERLEIVERCRKILKEGE